MRSFALAATSCGEALERPVKFGEEIYPSIYIYIFIVSRSMYMYISFLKPYELLAYPELESESRRRRLGSSSCPPGYSHSSVVPHTLKPASSI